MAKFTSKNIEFLDNQKAIFGSNDESNIHWNPDNTELTITTVVSGVDPTEDGHLITRRHYDAGKPIAQWNADQGQGIDFPTPSPGDDKFFLQYDHDTTSYTLVSGTGGSGETVTTELDMEYFSPIWAEENAALGTTTFEWAYGNGANTPSDRGIVVYVPSGWSCEVVAMSLSINAGTATVELNFNGVNQGSTANVSVSTGNHAVNTFTGVSVSNGDVVNFRTQVAAGTSGPCQVVAWLRFYKTVEITTAAGGAETFLDLTDTPDTYSGFDGQYLRATTSGLEFATVSGGVIDHGGLMGLDDDDHTQYHNDGRADTWLGTKSIDDVGDVVTPSPVDGQVLTWSGSNWYSQPIPAPSDGVTLTGEWKFDDSTSDADPGNGKFRLDNATSANATYVYISDTTDNGFDSSFLISKLKLGDAVYIQRKSDATESVLYEVAGDPIDATSYWKIPVQNGSSGGTEFVKNKVCGVVFHYSRQNTSDHGDLTGLGDDDHTQYILVNGTRAFTNTVGGVTPTSDSHLTTKQYVDDEITSVSGEIIKDHGNLTGLSDDDHLQYVPRDGSRGFTDTVSGVDPITDDHLVTKGYLENLLDPTASGSIGNVLFGSEFEYEISEGTSSTNSTTYQEKVSITVSDIPEGSYRLGWHFDWRISKSNREFEYRIQQDDTTDLEEDSISPFVDVNVWNPITNFYYMPTLSSGTHTFDLDYSSSRSNSTAYIRAARFEFWRVI